MYLPRARERQDREVGRDLVELAVLELLRREREREVTSKATHDQPEHLERGHGPFHRPTRPANGASITMTNNSQNQSTAVSFSASASPGITNHKGHQGGIKTATAVDSTVRL
jgi:hypothetical protein